MPIYTFINKLTNERYEKIMTYEELIEYIKDPNIEQEYKLNMFRYSDNNGIKDQETDWMRDPVIRGNGAFKPYGKVKTSDDNNNFKVMKDKKHFSETKED
jgi:hypothetical protein